MSILQPGVLREPVSFLEFPGDLQKVRKALDQAWMECWLSTVFILTTTTTTK